MAAGRGEVKEACRGQVSLREQASPALRAATHRRLWGVIFHPLEAFQKLAVEAPLPVDLAQHRSGVGLGDRAPDRTVPGAQGLAPVRAARSPLPGAGKQPSVPARRREAGAI